MSSPKHLLPFALPGVLFGTALFFQKQLSHVPAALEPLLASFPAVAAIAGLFLGWRFNRSRIIWAVLLLVLLERLTVLSTHPLHDYLFTVGPLLLPVNFLLLGFWKERGFLTVHGLLRTGFFLAQIGGVAWLYLHRADDLMNCFSRSFVPFETSLLPGVNPLVILSASFCLLGLLVRFWTKPDALSGGFLWATSAAIAGYAQPEQFSFWSGTAALILVVGVVESGFSMAFNDELTGLPARRAMNELLLKVGRCYSIAMVDIDHFKQVNDTHGHDVGDQVLRMVAGCLRGVGGGGRVFRYGGEEFAVIFPGKSVEEVLPVLDRLRLKISQSGFVLRSRNRPRKKPEKIIKSRGTFKLTVTASMGVAERNGQLTTPDQVIKAADKALYKAKKGGRNRVCN